MVGKVNVTLLRGPGAARAEIAVRGGGRAGTARAREWATRSRRAKHFPGPMHALELADRLKLTPEQKARTEGLMQEHESAGARDRREARGRRDADRSAIPGGAGQRRRAEGCGHAGGGASRRIQAVAPRDPPAHARAPHAGAGGAVRRGAWLWQGNVEPPSWKETSLICEPFFLLSFSPCPSSRSRSRPTARCAGSTRTRRSSRSGTGPLPQLDMPHPMTMVYRVKDPTPLDRVKAGDQVQFEAEKVNGAFVVTRIEGENSGLYARHARAGARYGVSPLPLLRPAARRRDSVLSLH